MLSNDNIKALESLEYEYIIEARIRNETEAIKSQIFSNAFSDRKTIRIPKNDNTSLIVNYSNTITTKDAYKRKRGLNRLESQIKRDRLTKAKIYYRGYNKYLKINWHLVIKIDYDKYLKDKA